MASSRNASFTKLIKENIRRDGCHIYLVTQGAVPRFVYTIGLTESFGAEIVLAGGYYYDDDSAVSVVSSISQRLKGERLSAVGRKYTLKGLGTFLLGEVHPSWNASLLLGAHDYYKARSVEAYQVIVPDDRRTIDTPDMAKLWTSKSEPPWKWMKEPWPFSCADDCTTVTNLKALRGEPITEVVRWEKDEWEMFAGSGPDVPESEMRVVSLGTMLGHDPTLAAATKLRKKEGVWRDSGTSEWHSWKRSR